MIRRYPRLRAALNRNAEELSERVISPDDCKEIANKINRKKNIVGLRFNSIGELINEIHISNLQNIAYYVSPKIPITLWTKRPLLLFKVLKVPTFKVIYSNPAINQFVFPTDCDDRIQHTFNVYDNPEKMQEAINFVRLCGRKCIECSGSCKDCMVCYSTTEQERCVIFERTKRRFK